MTLRTSALALSLLLAAAHAPAQDQDAPPPSGNERGGFIMGFSLGAGFSTVYHPSFSAYVGGMATPKLAVMLEGYGVGRDNDETHGIIAAGVQYFPKDRYWLKAGIGYGNSDHDDFGDFEFDDNSGEGRLGLLAGAGVEVVRSGRFTLDLQLRGVATSGGAGSSGSVNIGLNWY